MISRNRLCLTFLLLLITFLVISFFSIRIGAFYIDSSTLLRIMLGKTSQADLLAEQVLLNIRLPRVLAAILVGGSLSVSGAIMQGLFKNPLVDPGIVGVMSGASLSVTFSIVILAGIFPFLSISNPFFLPISAFFGSWIVTLILYFLAKKGDGVNIAIMLLIGIAISGIAGALTGLLTYVSDDSQLRAVTFWNLGSLASFSWTKLLILFTVCLIVIPILLRQSYVLNAIMLGDNVAAHLGFNVNKFQKQQIFLVALIVGTCVAFSGGIGFLGLVVPHIARGLLGGDNRYVLPSSFLIGAILLSSSDLVARTIISPAELPIGILTALIGSPFLGYLVIKGSK